MKRYISVFGLLVLLGIAVGCTAPVQTIEEVTYIEITYPNGGEAWDDIGRPVSFKAQGLKRVNIDLEDWRGEAAGGPLTWRLETNLPVESSGKYAVTRLKDLSPSVRSGDQFRINVYDATVKPGQCNLTGDDSDDYFSITITPR